jgi:hypothetical protein
MSASFKKQYSLRNKFRLLRRVNRFLASYLFSINPKDVYAKIVFLGRRDATKPDYAQSCNGRGRSRPVEVYSGLPWQSPPINVCVREGRLTPPLF